jgi:hypothetical protein
MKLANGLALDNRAGKIVLGLLLPVLVVVLWQVAGPNGSLFVADAGPGLDRVEDLGVRPGRHGTQPLQRHLAR